MTDRCGATGACGSGCPTGMDELEALEHRGWEALSGPRGAEFYDKVMDDDGLMVFPGVVLNKAESLRAIAGARPWSSHRLDELRVMTTGEIAVVTYQATSQREGEDEYQARMSSVYARSGGRWRLILHQQSPDPAR